MDILLFLVLLGYLLLSLLYKLFWGAYWSDLSKLIAAKLGFVPAQMFFGDRYYRGVLVKKDYEKAFYWYKQAATRDNTEAQDNIAAMYEKGEGVVKNYDQAVHWYEKALSGHERSAEQGDASAQFMCARYYIKFRSEENYIEAYKWLVLAKSKTTNDDDHKTIDEGLKFLEEQMTDSQIEEAQNLASQF